MSVYDWSFQFAPGLVVGFGNGFTAVCEFSLAVDNRHTSGTDWFKVVAWAGLAETLAEHKTRRPGRRPNAALRVPAGRPAAALDRGFATRRDRF